MTGGIVGWLDQGRTARDAGSSIASTLFDDVKVSLLERIQQNLINDGFESRLDNLESVADNAMEMTNLVQLCYLSSDHQIRLSAGVAVHPEIDYFRQWCRIAGVSNPIAKRKVIRTLFWGISIF